VLELTRERLREWWERNHLIAPSRKLDQRNFIRVQSSSSKGSKANSLILLEATPGIEPGYTVLQTTRKARFSTA